MSNEKELYASNQSSRTCDPKQTYQFLEKLGEGTYATVYKAVNKINDTIVAVKVIDRTHDEYSYINEINFLRKVSHPYISNLHDVFFLDNEVWLILEYCQLGSIEDIMKITNTTLTEPEIAWVSYCILQALDFLHTIKKIHRDIKPANVLVNSTGQVKVTDFGICSKNQMAESFIGTLLWMAPEQLAGEKYDTSVDIWALGICVIEMAEGNAPFGQLNPMRVKFNIQNRPQLTFDKPEKFSKELNEFLACCLQTKPEKRTKAIDLLHHAFISKYKLEFAQIKKSMSLDRARMMDEAKQKLSESSEKFFNHEKDCEASDLDSVSQSNIELSEKAKDSNEIREENQIETASASEEVKKSLSNSIDYDDEIAEESAIIEVTNNQTVIEKSSKPSIITDHGERSYAIADEDDDQASVSNMELALKSVGKNFLDSPKNKIFEKMKSSPAKLSILSSSSEADQSHLILCDETPIDKMNIMVPSLPSCRNKGLNSKAYRSVNESNFKVKHKESEVKFATEEYSLESESHINGMSFTKSKFDFNQSSSYEFVSSLQGNFNFNKSNFCLADLEKMSTTRDLRACLEMAIPQPDQILSVIRENLHVPAKGKKTKEQIMEESLKLEEKMKKELDNIKKKYMKKFERLHTEE